MVKVYEIDIVEFGELSMELEINTRIREEKINPKDIVGISWRNRNTLSIFVRQ